MKSPAIAFPNVSILMYHQVGRFSSPKTHRAVFCSVDRFRVQMAWLKLSGNHVISLDDAWKGLFHGAPLPTRPVVLTFDDGYENFSEHAWPVLQRYNYPATVFLVSNYIGDQAPWLDETMPPSRLMNASTIRRLHNEGVSFGSHTLTHCRLSRLEQGQQRAEIFDSKAAIEDLFGDAVHDFCYPYGDYDVRSRDLLSEAGYRLGLTCIRGAANTAHNAYEIPRKAISYGDSLFGFFWKLHLKNARKDHSIHNPEHIVKGQNGNNTSRL